MTINKTFLLSFAIGLALSTPGFADILSYYDFEEGIDNNGNTGTTPTTEAWIIDKGALECHLTVTNSNNGSPLYCTNTSSDSPGNLSLCFGVDGSDNRTNAVQPTFNSDSFQWYGEQPKTMEFFICRNGDGWDSSSTEYVFSKSFLAWGGWDITFDRDSKTIKFSIRDQAISSTTTFEDNEWHHVAIVRDADANTYTLFVDYIAEASIEYSSGSVKNEPLTIGAGYGWTNQRCFVGCIDDIRISDTALQANEFLGANTVAFWQFNEGIDGFGTSGSVPSNVGWIISNYNNEITAGTANLSNNGPLYSSDSSNDLHIQFTDDDDDYITIPQSDIITLDYGEDFTLEYYIRVDNENYASSPLNWIMHKGTADSSNKGWGFYWNYYTGQLTFALANRQITSNIDISDGYWYHVAVTHTANSDTYDLYIDKQWQGAISDYNDNTDHANDLVIGQGPGWQSERDFIGDIDNLKISSIALTSDMFLNIPKKDITLARKCRFLNDLNTRASLYGKQDTYAIMRNSLTQKFQTLISRMISDGKTELAAFATRYLDKIIDDEILRLEAITRDEIACTNSPRRVATEMPQMIGSHLEQKVQWANGTIETRPVFLYGFCGEQQDIQPDLSFISEALGANLIHLFTGPRYTMPDESMWNAEAPLESSLDSGVISYYMSTINEAYNTGIITDLNICPHWIQSWFIDKYPDYYALLGGFINYEFNHPEVQKIVGYTSQLTIQALTEQPGIWSCCLINEPAFMFWDDDATPDMWVDYLKNTYGTISAMNSAWLTSYSNWNSVKMYKHQPSIPFPDDPELYDWMKFNDYRVNNWLDWLQGHVKAADNSIYTHTKQIIRYYTQEHVLQGSDIDLMPRTTDIAGQDGSIAPWDTVNTEDISLFGSAACATLPVVTQKTITAKPVINSENHILRDNNNEDVAAGHARAALWLQALAGLDASAAWLWGNNTDSSFQTGMWLDRPLAMEEYSRTGMDLMRLMPELVQIREKNKKVVLLYSKTSALRNPDYDTILFNTYDVLKELGFSLAVITEQVLANNEYNIIKNIETMILPGCTHIPDNTFNSLISFANSNSIKLIGIGSNIGYYNQFCQTRSTIFNNNDYYNLANTDLIALQNSLYQTMLSIGSGPDIVLLDSASNEITFDIHHANRKVDSRHLVTLINTSDSQKSFFIQDNEGKRKVFVDTLNIYPKETSTLLKLEPLEVAFGYLVDPGDANMDGCINNEDLTTLSINWLSNNAEWENGDFNNDQIIDIKDVGILSTYWLCR